MATEKRPLTPAPLYPRRQFTAATLGTLGGLLTAPRGTFAALGTQRSSLFCASVGANLFTYALGTTSPSFRPLGTAASVPAEVQCGWSDPARHTLYIACSDEQTTRAGKHFLCAFRLRAAGDLQPLGQPVALQARPIYLTGDHSGAYLLTAYNRPSSLTVHTVREDGTVGDLIPPPTPLNTGVYAHQVRMFPSNRAVLLMARGNQAASGKPEDPGALEVFGFERGRLSNAQSVAPHEGRGFRPRHADFHPSGRCVYVALESSNQIHTYTVKDDRLSAAPMFVNSTIQSPDTPKEGQMASAIVAHPEGRTLYVANRGTGTADYHGERVSNGGENTIAVFSLNPNTGEPSLVQSIDSRGIHVRTMDLSSDGRWLVTASITAGKLRTGNRVTPVPAGLSLFSIDTTGRLTFQSRHAIDAPDERVFWVGRVG